MSLSGRNLLSQDIKYLKGVGPRRADVLAKELRIFTVRDLLYTFPFRYIDRSCIHRIRDLQADMPYVQLKGQIADMGEEGTGRKKRVRAVFTDGTGFVELVWFGGLRYVLENYKVGRTYLLLGKPGVFNGRFSFSHPELDKIGEEDVPPQLGLQPVYHTTEAMKRCGMTSRTLQQLVQTAFAMVGTEALAETLPPYFIAKHHLLPLTTALRSAHYPATAEALPPALHRLKFEELFYLQLDILRYAKDRRENRHGFIFSHIGDNFMRFYNERLPFRLTAAQQRVVKEIRKDVRTGRQMNRLLQGDVGSGKTVVALLACLMALDNGFQACLMAPTEILAEQHYATLREMLGELPITVELLTGNVKGKRRQKTLASTADGSVKILVGTHALIEPTVRFLNLGLVIIDEQHRFGVKQRAKLWQKNVQPPHVLVMTATPIPRTLAMTVYGDLDVSVIDELPPGRKPIKTLHFYNNRLAKLFDGVRYQLHLGRQVYFVFPLIEKSEKMDLQDLEKGYTNILAAFPNIPVAKVHGRMKPDEKEAAMHRFATGEARILVSTTVIEVGVNVPNASVMVIINAERFGLAQLHQLRGRVGRGADQSYCVLVTKLELSEDTRRRIRIMLESTDGFEIAEEDLKLRGPGDLEGTQQSGIPFDLKVASLARDGLLLEQARHAAAEVLEQDPRQELPQNEIIWRQLRVLKKEMTNYSAIS